MQKYDVFKSQGGYGVAMGVYLNCPVVGSILETEDEAETFAKNKKAYDRDYTQFEEKLEYLKQEEIERLKCPTPEDFNLNVGITI